MAFLSPLRESRASVVPGLRPKDPALADMFTGINSKSGQNVTADTAMRVSTVFACVTVLSQTLAMLPKYVKQVRDDGGRDILRNHRLFELIQNRPNRWQDDFEYFEMLEGHRLLRGNAYARIVATPGRGLNELVPMHPDRIWPFVITPTGMTYYMYDNSPPPPAGSKLYYQYFPLDGQTEILTADEVHHIRGFSTNGIVGIDPIKRAAREAIGLAMAAEETGSQLFGNSAKMSVAVKHPGKLNDITYDRMKKEISEKITGSNSFKPFFLEDGMDIVNLGMKMVDAQFLENRKFQVEDIARIFNVPLVLIGHGDKAPTYASAEQFFMSFKVHTMQANVTRWEKAMKRDLFYSSEKNLIFDFDMDALMRGDAVARSTYLKNRFGMASISPDGVRLYEGENPSGQEGSDKLYIMMNMVPLKDAGIRMTSKVAAKGETVESGLENNQGATQ
jgi:HK97 family phage portal protein